MKLVFTLAKTFVLAIILFASFNVFGQENNAVEVSSLKEELLKQQELLVEIIKNQDSLVSRNTALYKELQNLNIPSTSKKTEVAITAEPRVDLFTREIISFDYATEDTVVN